MMPGAAAGECVRGGDGITVAFLGFYTIGAIAHYRRALRQADVTAYRSREAS